MQRTRVVHARCVYLIHAASSLCRKRIRGSPHNSSNDSAREFGAPKDRRDRSRPLVVLSYSQSRNTVRIFDAATEHRRDRFDIERRVIDQFSHAFSLVFRGLEYVSAVELYEFHGFHSNGKIYISVKYREEKDVKRVRNYLRKEVER